MLCVTGYDIPQFSCPDSVSLQLLTALTQSVTEEKKKKKLAVETTKSLHFTCEQHHMNYAMETTHISKIAQPNKDNPKSTLNRWEYSVSQLDF